MQVTLKFFATFREIVGSKTIDREFPEDTVIGDILHRLEEEYEEMVGELLVDGDLKPQINVLKNGREVLHMQGIETAVEPGDTVSIFPPVAGGDR